MSYFVSKFDPYVSVAFEIVMLLNQASIGLIKSEACQTEITSASSVGRTANSCRGF